LFLPANYELVNVLSCCAPLARATIILTRRKTSVNIFF